MQFTHEAQKPQILQLYEEQATQTPLNVTKVGSPSHIG
jgi:hypothetical protein